MTTLRTIFRVIVFSVLPVLVIAWVFMMALTTTVLNPQAVKGWAANSGIYNNFTGQVVDLESELEDQVHIDVATLQKTIDQTFPPSYIQQQGETIIDATYAWVNSSSSEPTFTVPINQKGEEFAGKLQTLLEPQFASYPQCPITLRSASDFWNTKCLPAGYTPESYAERVASEAAEETTLFEKPFTGQDLALPSDIRNLPQVISTFKLCLWIISVSILVLGGLYLLLSIKRLKGMGRLGRLMVICGLITLIVGGIVWVFNDSIAALIKEVMELSLQGIVGPLVEAAVPSVGMWVSVYSGIVIVVGVILWVVSHFVGQRKKSLASETPVITTPSVPVPPVASKK